MYSSSEERLLTAQQGMAQAPEDLDAALRHVTAQLVSLYQHSRSMVIVLTQLTLFGLTTFVVLSVVGVFDVILAAPDQRLLTAHALWIALSSISAGTLTSWLVRSKLLREMSRQVRELLYLRALQDNLGH
jgi:hypothetical protein